MSPHGIGVGNAPAVCYLTEYKRYLPNKYGGAAAATGSNDLRKPLGIPSGAIFAFSGIDGKTNTSSQFVGWFTNDSYSIYFWLPQPRILKLGFLKTKFLGGESDNVIFATNDALLVENWAGSRVAVTWKNWHTVVGFVEGPDAYVHLEFCIYIKGTCVVELQENVTISPIDILVLSLGNATTENSNVHPFALCYGHDLHDTIQYCEENANENVVNELYNRHNFILGALPPLEAEKDERFQRKLLSVMKVNQLSPEGNISHIWSTTARAPHKWFFLWDGMMQTIAMNHVNAHFGAEYIRSFFLFQNNISGQLCATIGPKGCLEYNNAMPPFVAMATWDNYLQNMNKTILKEFFSPLEKYIQYQITYKSRIIENKHTLMYWDNACEAGMDHEQVFCKSDTDVCCKSTHYSVDYQVYIISEAQFLGNIARELEKPLRQSYWLETVTDFTDSLNALLWNPMTNFYHDLYFDGSFVPYKTVSGFYPLLIENMPQCRIEAMVKMMYNDIFKTAVPIPTVATDTFDFSTDLDRGPMWFQQNFYIIRGLRKHGFHEAADELKSLSLNTAQIYYEKWGVVFEFYDSLNKTSPVQTLRKPSVADSGTCRKGIPGPPGHCGCGGIRDYNFCAGLPLLWLLGNE